MSDKVKITISDPWLGKREIEATALALIRDQHKLLCLYRDDGRIPSKELLEDITAYEAIMQAPDPEEFAKRYFEKKKELHTQRDSFNVRVSEALALLSGRA